MALLENDINGSEFTVGDEVSLRGIVTSITSASGATKGYGGSADSVAVTIDVAGNVGEKVATVIVSPVQCRRAWGQTAFPPGVAV
jgi:hypothetical protein